MSRRVTIVIDTPTDKTLRQLQAYTIKSTGASYSYSEVVRDVLRKGLK